MTDPSLAATAARIVGIALLGGVVSLGAAVVYRWYARQTLPEGVAVLLGLSTAAVWLNTTAALGQAIGGRTGLLDPATAGYTVAAFAVTAVAADGGRRAGDRLSVTLPSVDARSVDTDVSEFVRAAGRVVAVTLPEEIDDIDGYDPVPDDRKATLAGTTLLFPRRLTVAELRSRLIERLVADYGIGHVDVELDADGTVEYLAVGSRAAGLGPTLAPGTVAVAIRADPAFSASPGDAVQVWTGGPDPDRVTTAELRAAVDDVVTLAVDETDAAAIDPDGSYRLVTLPTEPGVDREFASLLRTADETMRAATVAPDSPLVGLPVAALDVTVAAIADAEGVEAIPPGDRTVAAGDTVYVVARPDRIRRFETAATGEPTDSIASAPE